MTLSIIIPVYNEEKTVVQIFYKVLAAPLPYKITKTEIILINDGSTDNTKSILQKIDANMRVTRVTEPQAGRNIKILHHRKNRGKGAAIRTGLKKAKGHILLIQDADLEYNPRDYPRLLKPILNKTTHVVYGTRLVNYPLLLWGPHKTPHPANWIANHFVSFLTNTLYKSSLTDMETGYKVFTKTALSSIRLKSNRFDFEPEITAKILKAGFTIREIPIKTTPRSYKEGKKIGWKDGVFAIWTLLKYKFTD